MKIIRSVFIIIFAILIVSSLIFMMRMDFLKIQSIAIKGNVSIKTEDIRDAAQQMISGDYLYTLPKDNVLVFPKEKILNELSKKFPRIDTLKVSLEKNILELSMTERKPHALWCGSSFIQNVDPCFFVDSQGFVFAQAPQFDGSSYLKLYGSTPTVADDATTTEDVLPDGNQPIPAWQFISEKEYTNVQNFIDNTKVLGLELSALELSDTNTYKFQIKNNGLLMANRSVDLSETLENLKAGLSNDIFWTNKKNQKKLNQLEYIDMRYGNKIFYKLGGQ